MTLFFLSMLLSIHAIHLSPVLATDSLLRLLDKQPHDSTRLITLHTLARLNQTSPTFIQYEEQLLQEAILQKNIKYQCIAMHNHVIYYYNHNDKEQVQEWMKRLSEIAPRNGEYELYFDAKQWLIELYFLREEMEMGIYEAQKMETEAIQQNNPHEQMVANLCLLSGYISTLQFDQALKVADKAYSLLAPKASPLIRANTLMRIISVYTFMKEDEKLGKALSELQQAYDEIDPTLQNAYSNISMFIAANYVIYYLHKKEPEQALIQLDTMEHYYDPSFYLSYKIERFTAYTEFYKYNKEYNKALAACDSIILLVKDQYPSVVTAQNIKKADILMAAGRMSEALPLYKKAIAENDSINLSVSRKQMEQIQSIYDVEKLLLEKEQLKSTHQMIILFVIGIMLILSAGFTFRFYRARRVLRRSEHETREATRITEETNEIKSRFLSNMSYNIRIPLNNVVGFSQLIAIDPNIDEETLAEYSKIIQKNAEELIQLVNDVLDLSRLEAKMMRFNVIDYGIIDICNDVLGQVRMKENTIQANFTPEAQNHLVHVDTSRINQVLLSLLMYPEPCTQPRRVTLKLKEETGTFTFRICNTPLADPAFLNQSVAVRHEINRLIVEHFGGKYKVKSKQTEEPTVIFTLPMAEASKMTE